MDKHNPAQWLTQQIETAVQLSGKPPKIAVWGVVLKLPGDVVEILKDRGIVYEFAGHRWFDYKKEETTVCVPIQTE